MISRLAGALFRAFLVVLLVATPSLLLPDATGDASQMAVLVAIFAAALTFFEYSSTYPGLVEFRQAPPFNRIRFVSLLTMVSLLSLVIRGTSDPTPATRTVTELGVLIANAMDFPFSPVRLIVLMLPPAADPEQVRLVQTGAGISYLVSLLTLALFVILLSLHRWPQRLKAFNVWINLPTFAPSASGDVVRRLERDARVNIALGFLLPFLTPVIVRTVAAAFGTISLDGPLTFIWTVSAWAFLPASLFMRGIALRRVAAMIAAERRRSAETETTDWVPASA